MHRKKSKKRKSLKSQGKHRPVIYKRGKKFYRPKKSKLFPEKTTLEGRRVPEPKEKIIIREGYLMSKGKRKMSEKQKSALAQGRKRAASKRTLGFDGFDGRKKKAKVVHRVVMQGDPGSSATGVGLDLAGLLAGAIGLSFVASFIPIKNPKFKALIPMAAGMTGLFFPAISGNRFFNRFALGALAIGGYSLTKQFLPKLPLMGATDTAEGIGEAIQNLPPEEKAILGLLPEDQSPRQVEYNGEQPEWMLGETEMISGLPGEMLGSEPGEMLGSEPDEMLGATESIGGRENGDFE